jgi:hypothetical protein
MVLVGQVQRLLVAGRVAETVTCSRTAPVAAITTAAVWCPWGVDPMTSSTVSASMAMR